MAARDAGDGNAGGGRIDRDRDSVREWTGPRGHGDLDGDGALGDYDDLNGGDLGEGGLGGGVGGGERCGEVGAGGAGGLAGGAGGFAGC
ncbi:hypothetical protein ACIQOU_09545 [Streptomyces sp. NPDC091279]|uniref:hypothetical protein n=1 Tax=unclassified Streptomyces TaxID=2593676 RepID=UPI0037F4BC8C